MREQVQIVVACAERKTRPVPGERQFRNVGGGSLEDRVREWVHAIEETGDATGDSIAARELYAGDHWTVVKSLERIGEDKGWNLSIWVMSAGYGLISINEQIRSYAATFSPEHPDYVGRDPRGNGEEGLAQRWWKALTLWRRSASGTPRSIRELAEQSPNRGLMIAASPAYLRAATSDIEAARESLSSRDLLTLFTAATGSIGTLNESRIPASARAQGRLGGALNSLNVRLVKRALEETEDPKHLTQTALASWAKELIAMEPDKLRIKHAVMSDAEVRSYIADRVREMPGASHTRLLRDLRTSGRACEQSRFRRLFREVAGPSRGK